MRERFNQMDFAGEIVIGEGEKDKSCGLFHGERVGKFRRGKGQKRYALAVEDGLQLYNQIKRC